MKFKICYWCLVELKVVYDSIQRITTLSNQKKDSHHVFELIVLNRIEYGAGMGFFGIYHSPCFVS